MTSALASSACLHVQDLRCPAPIAPPRAVVGLKRQAAESASKLLHDLLVTPACQRLQQEVAADAGLQRTIVQLMLQIALPQAAAVIQHASGAQGGTGSGSQSTAGADQDESSGGGDGSAPRVR